jgi:arsenate reductase
VSKYAERTDILLMDEFRGIDFDCVVTLCDNVSKSRSAFKGKTKFINKSFDDPYLAAGDEKIVLAMFRKVRDQTKAFVEKMPGNLHRVGEK